MNAKKGAKEISGDDPMTCTITVNRKQVDYKEGSGTVGSAFCGTYGFLTTST